MHNGIFWCYKMQRRGKAGFKREDIVKLTQKQWNEIKKLISEELENDILLSNIPKGKGIKINLKVDKNIDFVVIGEQLSEFLAITPSIRDEVAQKRERSITHIPSGLAFGVGSRKDMLQLFEKIKDLDIDWNTEANLIKSPDFDKLREAVCNSK